MLVFFFFYKHDDLIFLHFFSCMKSSAAPPLLAHTRRVHEHTFSCWMLAEYAVDSNNMKIISLFFFPLLFFYCCSSVSAYIIWVRVKLPFYELFFLFIQFTVYLGCCCCCSLPCFPLFRVVCFFVYIYIHSFFCFFHFDENMNIR